MSFPLSTELYHIVNTFKAVIAAPDDALLNEAKSLHDIAVVLAYYGMSSNGVWHKALAEKTTLHGGTRLVVEWANISIDEMATALLGGESNIMNGEERALTVARMMVDWQIEGGVKFNALEWDKTPLGMAYAQYKHIYKYYNQRGADGKGHLDRDAIVIHEALNGGYHLIGGLQPGFHERLDEYIASLTAAFNGDPLPEWVAQQEEERLKRDDEEAHQRALKRKALAGITAKYTHTHDTSETHNYSGRRHEHITKHWHVTLTIDDHPNQRTLVYPDFRTGDAYTNSKIGRDYNLRTGKTEKKHILGPEDIISSLISDAQIALSGTTIDEIAEEFGITKPSEAIRIHTECHRILRELRQFLGEERFNKALEVQW